MKYAKLKNLDFIYHILKIYFDYVRKDNLTLMIKQDRIIFDSNILIGFRKYKKKVRIGNMYAPKGSYIVYWIINVKRSNKKNWIKVITDFCKNKTIFYKTKNREEIKNLLDLGFEKIHKDKITILIKKNELGIL